MQTSPRNVGILSGAVISFVAIIVLSVLAKVLSANRHRTDGQTTWAMICTLGVGVCSTFAGFAARWIQKVAMKATDPLQLGPIEGEVPASEQPAFAKMETLGPDSPRRLNNQVYQEVITKVLGTDRLEKLEEALENFEVTKEEAELILELFPVKAHKSQARGMLKRAMARNRDAGKGKSRNLLQKIQYAKTRTLSKLDSVKEDGDKVESPEETAE